MRLAGKVAVVTGAASGFGEGIAKKFVAEGAKVIVADRDGAGAERAAAALGAGASGVRADVTRAGDVKAMIEAAEQRFGAIDILVNNYGAGGGIELPFGGVKHSGHGREKGFEALYGFSTLKTVALLHG